MKCVAALLLAFFGVAVYVSAQSPTSSSPIKPGDLAKPDQHSSPPPPPPGNASPSSPPVSGSPKAADNSKPNVDPNKPNVDPNSKPNVDPKSSQPPKPADDKKPVGKETPPTRTRRDDTNAQKPAEQAKPADQKPAEQAKPADQKPSEQQKANGQKFQLPSGGVPVGQAKDQIKSPKFRVRRQSSQSDGQQRRKPEQYSGPPDKTGNTDGQQNQLGHQQPGQIYNQLGKQGHQTYVPRSGPQPAPSRHTDQNAPAVPNPLDSSESRSKRDLFELGQNPENVPAGLPNDADSIEDEDSKDLSSNRHKRSGQVLEGKTLKDDSEEDSEDDRETFVSDENEQEYAHDPLNPISSRARRQAINSEGSHRQNKDGQRHQAGSGNADQAGEKKHHKKGERKEQSANGSSASVVNKSGDNSNETGGSGHN